MIGAAACAVLTNDAQLWLLPTWTERRDIHALAAAAKRVMLASCKQGTLVVVVAALFMRAVQLHGHANTAANTAADTAAAAGNSVSGIQYLNALEYLVIRAGHNASAAADTISDPHYLMRHVAGGQF